MTCPRCLHLQLALPFALLSVAAAAQDAAPSSPVPPTMSSRPVPSLSAEQLARLEKVALEQGSSIEVPAPVVHVLRFKPHEVAPTVRQATVVGEDHLRHGFALLVDNSGYLLFRRGGAGDLAVFRTDRQLQLLGAARQFEGDRFLEMPPLESQRELRAEIAVWQHVLAPPAGATAPAPRPSPPASVPAPPQKPAAARN